jgi:hypothetical protein
VTIETIDVNALVSASSKSNRTGSLECKEQLSSATGRQFLDDTWFQSRPKHRRDLTKGRSDKELFELRQDAELTKKIITLVEHMPGHCEAGPPLTSGSLT